MSRAQDHVPVKLYATDCEGPISKNDNAYELCERFLPEGAAFFERVSRYDDYLADVVRKPGYRPGDTLRLILPFLRAYGVSDGDAEEFSEATLLLMPGAKEAIGFLKARMPVYMISTSYRPYVRALCRALDLPEDRTYSTEVAFDRYEVREEERRLLGELLEEIVGMPLIQLPPEAKAPNDLDPESREVALRMDEIFWKVLPGTSCWRMAEDVRPVGGEEKARALEKALTREGGRPEHALYVGDSITDMEAFGWLRSRGGLTISFNGNRYALREAELACISGNALVLAAVGEMFRREGKEGVRKLTEGWGPDVLGELLGPELADSFPSDPPPKLVRITEGNREALTAESEKVRKQVRGEAVGRLG
ncbi:MAG: hypothetical protein DRQ08_09115 [Candidatus Latescibacterota bacterium]|nr:MAG: hypothetical protein DRQ08_09115 [Candidatus Latescibacterota bacterium]